MPEFEKQNQDYRSGFVALIGRPNVGKSSLLNRLVGEKVAITSPVAQTTRTRLRAIVTTPYAQLVILDTPGIHKPHHLLGERLVNSARSSIGEVDIVLLMFEGCQSPGRGDVFIVNLLKRNKKPVFVVLNKWDLVQGEQSFNLQSQYEQLLDGTEWPLYKCSAVSGEGCNEILDSLEQKLPLGPALYPKGMVSDQPEKVLLSELIREQVLILTREEIPHSVAVSIDRIDEMKELKGKQNTKLKIAILATIIVERKSQKGILIGRGGSMLKNIGKGARLQMQNFFDGPVYLELFVKVIPGWRSKPARLQELGYVDS